MRKKRQPTKLASLLPGFLVDLQPEAIAEAIRRWPAVAGERVAQAAQPVAWREGTLEVAVRSSTWAQELRFLAPELVARYATLAPALGVRDLRFDCRWWNDEPVRARPLAPPVRPAEPPSEAPAPEDLAGLEEDLAACREPAVRAALRRVRVAAAGRRRGRLMAGWEQCGSCGALTPTEETGCAYCRVVGGATKSSQEKRR